MCAHVRVRACVCVFEREAETQIYFPGVCVIMMGAGSACVRAMGTAVL